MWSLIYGEIQRIKSKSCFMIQESWLSCTRFGIVSDPLSRNLVNILVAITALLFIQESAASAFGAVCREYYYNMADTTDDLIGRFITELESTNRFSR